MKAIVEAPHKILLSGAYTVLDGYPALGLAVEPRLQVAVDLSLPEQWPQKNPFAMAVREVVSTTLRAQAPKLHPSSWGQFSTSTHQATHGWGLGSSASFTSALLTALFQATGLSLSTEAIFAKARQAHRMAQQGQGSGVDIAACCFGGLVLVSHAEGDATPKVVSALWPEEIEILLIRSPQKADTRQMIDLYRGSDTKGPLEERRELLRSIGRVARTLGEGGDLLPALAENARCEEVWSQKVGIPLVTELQKKIQDAFHPLSLAGEIVIKSLGAGGGDSIGCFYRRDKLSLADIAAQLQAFTLQARPLRLERQGLDLAPKDFSIFPLPSPFPQEAPEDQPPPPFTNPSPGQF